MGTLWSSRARVSALLTSSSLGGCTDLSPEELSLDELLESELELSSEDELFESELSLLSVSAELSLWPSLSSSGLSLASSLEELSPAGAGSVSSPAGGGSLPSTDAEELELSSLEEESESDLFSSSSNMALRSPLRVWMA
jgi:hypothetical protein